MTTRFRWLYVGAAITALLQTGILYAAIEKRASILRSGAEVTLQTEPFDPRDLMRGDYVVLAYEISSLARKEIGGTPSAGSRAVYVAVKPDANGIARISRASFAPLSTLLRTKCRSAAKPHPPYPMIRNRMFVSISASNDIMYLKGRDGRSRTASESVASPPLLRSIRKARRSSKPCKTMEGSSIRSRYIDPDGTSFLKRVG